MASITKIFAIKCVIAYRSGLIRYLSHASLGLVKSRLIFANQHQFDREDAILSARGVPPALIGDGSGDRETNGGIHAPTRKELRSGTRIVRFSGSSDEKRPQLGQRSTGRGGSPIPAMAVAGGWWLEWPEYKIVEAFAGASGMSISQAIGQLCCVPTEWNDATVVVQATIKTPLLAYAGLGAPARGKAGVLDGGNPLGRKVIQLYIPGMGSADVRRDALMVEGVGFLPAS